MTPEASPKSVGEMMADILGNVSNLVRNEVDLARAEVGESFGKVTGAIVQIAVAVVLAITALNLLAAALVGFVVWAGVPAPWAPVIVGAVLLIVALIMVQSARSTLKNTDFIPNRAARNVRKDAAAVKDAYNDK